MTERPASAMSPSPADQASELVHQAEKAAGGLEQAVRAWRGRHPGAPVVGFLPGVIPAMTVDAHGGLAVPLFGGMFDAEVVHGDALLPNYVCRCARTMLERAMGDAVALCDVVIAVDRCDVSDQLPDVLRVVGADERPWVRLTAPPDGAAANRGVAQLSSVLAELRGASPSRDDWQQAWAARAELGRALRSLDELRKSTPWKVPASELYRLRLLGRAVPPVELASTLRAYEALANARASDFRDRARVALRGVFCETPPPQLLMAIESAGCAVVDDDLLLSASQTCVEELGDDPVDAAAHHWLALSRRDLQAPQGHRWRREQLLRVVQEADIDAVVLAAPLFCVPARAEQHELARALEGANVPLLRLDYTENTSEYQAIRQQVGAFADGVRLWGRR